MCTNSSGWCIKAAIRYFIPRITALNLLGIIVQPIHSAEEKRFQELMLQLLKITILSIIFSLSSSISLSAENQIRIGSILTDASITADLFNNQNGGDRELDRPTEFQQKMVALNNDPTHESPSSRYATKDILQGDINSDGHIDLVDVIQGLKIV